MSASKLAKSIQQAVDHGQMRASDSIRMGEVVRVNPLEIELMDTNLILDEETLDYAAAAVVYMELNQLGDGDVCVVAHRNDDVDGTWIVLDFLDDNPTIPTTEAYVDAQITARAQVPPGTMALWNGSAPSGWLGVNGLAVTPGGGRDALRAQIIAWGSPWGSDSGDPLRPATADLPTAAPLDWIIKL